MTTPEIRDDVALLPCPICGKQPERNGRMGVGGVRCHGRSPEHFFQTYGATQDEADAAWNSRPEEDRLGIKLTENALSNAVAEVAATAIRQSFFTSVSGGGKYHLALTYRSMDEMHKAEDQIKMFLREPRFLPLAQRMKLRAQSEETRS